MIQFFDHGIGLFTSRRPIPPTRWDRFDLLCVHQGQITVTIESSLRHELSPGSGLLIYPNTRFEGRVERGRCRASVQHFKLDEQRIKQIKQVDATCVPEVLARLTGLSGGCEVVAARDELKLKRDIDRAMALAFERQTPHVIDQRLALLVLILSALDSGQRVRGSHGDPSWDELNAWLGQRVSQKIAIDAMAGQMAMSPAHFAHRFKEVFGISPGKHFQRLRMSECMRQLRETDEPIKSIALKLGYADLPNFYRSFKAVAGVSPAAYRQRHTLRG